MQMMIDAFQRALADCLRGKVLVWSLSPLLLMALMALGLSLVGWDAAVAQVQNWLHSAVGLQWLLGWIGDDGAAVVRTTAATVIAALLLSFVVVGLGLVLAAVVITPQMVEVVAAQRFMYLQRKHGAGLLRSIWHSISCALIALAVFLLTVPLWLVVPLMLVLPPLIVGWLTYKVMAFDALAVHASRIECAAIFKAHRYRLLVMGIVCGYLGAAPSIVWMSGLVFAAAFWILIPIAVWIYALVLVFSSLWFVHYSLMSLYQLRASAHA